MRELDLEVWGQRMARFVATLQAPVMAIYGREFDVALKSDQSPVTEADWWVHRQIMQFLAEMTPDIPVLSEEACEIPLSQRQQWQRWWLVDPLDGTKEFIAGSAEFTVNLALIEQGRSVFGLVGVPAQGLLYYGGKQHGAHRQQQGHTQPISASHRQQPLRVVASKRHSSPEQEALLAELSSKTSIELVNAGSSLKFCWLAEGRADFYPRLAPTSQWDTAAAQAVLAAAGGDIFTTQLTPLRYNTEDNILNPHFLALGDINAPWRKVLGDL